MRHLTLPLGLLLLLASCGGSSSSPTSITAVSLDIRGTAGREWSGAVGDDIGIRTESGRIPQSVPLTAKKGSFVGGTIQKQQGDASTLTVCIVVNGVDARCNTTTAAFGVVSVNGTVQSTGVVD